MQLLGLAKEMGIDEIFYDGILMELPEEKRSELMGRKKYFAEKAGIETE